MNEPEHRTSYYYNGGRRVPLVADPARYAVRFDLKRRTLSEAAELVLRAESAPAGFIAKYGLQLFHLSPRPEGAPDRRSPRGADEAIALLRREDGVRAVVPVYRATTTSKELIYPTNRFIAQFKPEVSERQVAALNARFTVAVARSLDPRDGGYLPGGFVLEAPGQPGLPDAVELANLYYESGLTIFAHPEFVWPLHWRAAPAAALQAPYDGALAARDAAADQQWHLRTARVTDAWEAFGRGRREITVAVLDDGVDVDHPAFRGKLKAQFDFESDSPDGRPRLSDDNHGTACAGVAVADADPGPGAAPGCGLMAIRTPSSLADADIAAMFQWAADNGAAVISCSWGPEDGAGAWPLPDAVRAAVRYCVARGRHGKGIPILWAAGNGDESMSGDGFAANPDVIAVAASTSAETRAPYSDFGKEIWICAPSSGRAALGHRRVFTTDRRGPEGYNSGNGAPGDAAGDYTGSFGGTSAAAPLVAGVVGLMLSANPALTVTQVRELLARTADKIGPDAYGDASAFGTRNDQLGHGRVNALEAVRAAQRLAGASVGEHTDESALLACEAWPRAAAPPVFELRMAPGEYGHFEVATAPRFFWRPDGDTGRSSANAWASWEERGFARSCRIPLPQAAWDRLKGADRIYYRLYISESEREWVNWRVVPPDDQLADAPALAITADADAGGGADAGDEEPDAGGEEPDAGGGETLSFPSGEIFVVVQDPEDGQDYSDPATGGEVPLIDVADQGRTPLSANFQVREFAASDGARYARIAPELIRRLQLLRDTLGRPVSINSGYRHPALNTAVGGARESRHLSGQAADIRVAGMTPLELARTVLAVVGCDIGIGLAATYVHVDVRGHTASWVYPNAELDAAEWNAEVRRICAEQAGRRARSLSAGRGPALIEGPTLYPRGHAAPTFRVAPRGDGFRVECAVHWRLFDAANHGKERTDTTFFASPRQRSTGPTVYRLPQDAWDRLRAHRAQADGPARLYYRVVDAPSHPAVAPQASTPDGSAAAAPWIELIEPLRERTGPTRKERDEALWAEPEVR